MINELLFSAGLVAVFRGQLTNSRLPTHPLPPSASTPRLPGTVHLPRTSHHLLELENRIPPFSAGRPRSQKRLPLGPHDFEDVFKGCPRPLLTTSWLCIHHSPTFLLTLDFCLLHLHFYRQPSRSINSPFSSITAILSTSLIWLAAILISLPFFTLFDA